MSIWNCDYMQLEWGHEGRIEALLKTKTLTVRVSV
jgi:hypothetical protein